MRTTIGNFDYLQNYADIIDVYLYNGTTDSFIARFTRNGEIMLSEIKLNNPFAMELYNTATKIFNGEITL